MSEVICVENDAKVDARCHTLKIDLDFLKCTKINAKEKEEEKEEEEEEQEKGGEEGGGGAAGEGGAAVGGREE